MENLDGNVCEKGTGTRGGDGSSTGKGGQTENTTSQHQHLVYKKITNFGESVMLS